MKNPNWIVDMKIIKVLVAFFLCAILNMSVFAQGMPPPAHPNSPYYVPPGAMSGNGVPQAQARWADKWGAIATDGKGNYGVSGQFDSEKLAKKAAIKDCENAGGGGCRIRIAYHNQCAAIVASEKGRTFLQTAAYENEAKEIASNRCADENGKHACWVYYSGCSLPVRVD